MLYNHPDEIRSIKEPENFNTELKILETDDNAIAQKVLQTEIVEQSEDEEYGEKNTQQDTNKIEILAQEQLPSQDEIETKKGMKEEIKIPMKKTLKKPQQKELPKQDTEEKVHHIKSIHKTTL